MVKNIITCYSWRRVLQVIWKDSEVLPSENASSVLRVKMPSKQEVPLIVRIIGFTLVKLYFTEMSYLHSMVCLSKILVIFSKTAPSKTNITLSSALLTSTASVFHNDSATVNETYLVRLESFSY